MFPNQLLFFFDCFLRRAQLAFVKNNQKRRVGFLFSLFFAKQKKREKREKREVKIN
jgi:hypothetical protein